MVASIASTGFRPHLVALYLLLIASLCIFQSVTAVTMASSQLNALLDVADQIPALKSLTIGAWTQTNIAASCDVANSALGVVSCDSTGLVTSLSLTSGSGPAPASIANMTALTTLFANYTMTGTLPDAWSSLKHLITIHIESPQLTGGIPASWSAMPLSAATIVFDASNSVLSVPPTWLSHLISYKIANVNWSETVFPEWLANSTVTTDAALINVPMAGSFPSALLENDLLGSFTYTSAPQGAHTSFGSGLALPSFAAMTALNSITLGGLSYSGSIGPATFPLSSASFTDVSLSDLPNISGTIPQSLLDASSLASLILDGLTQLIGNAVAPTDPSQSSLETLIYNNLGLNGTLPQQLLAGSLQTLTISNLKSLRGTIPEPYSAASINSNPDLACNLKSIVISGNSKLEGTIPASLAQQCDSINVLVLDSNNLTGAIPSSFESLASNVLHTLSISGNPNSGSIPSIGPWSPSSSLSLRLESAGLSGIIPASLLNQNFTVLSLAGNELDLCSTMATATQSYSSFFAATSDATCDLSFQSPQECGCPNTWPSACFTRREMLATCASNPSSPSATVAPAPNSESSPVSPPTSMPVASSPVATPTIVPTSTTPNSSHIRVEPLAICYSGEGSHQYFYFAYRNNNTFSVSASLTTGNAFSPSGSNLSYVASFEPGTHLFAVTVDNPATATASWTLDGYTATVSTACSNSTSVVFSVSFSSAVTNTSALARSVSILTGAPLSAITIESSSSKKRANEMTISVAPNAQVSTASISSAILNHAGSLSDGNAVGTASSLISNAPAMTVGEIQQSPVSAQPTIALPIGPPITEISWPTLHAPRGLGRGKIAGIIIGSSLGTILLVTILVVSLTATPRNPSMHSKPVSTTRRRYNQHASVATEPAYEAPSTTRTAGDDDSEGAPASKKRTPVIPVDFSTSSDSSDSSEEAAEEEDSE